MKIARKCICCGSADLSRNPAVLAPFVAYRVFGWEPVDITPSWGLRDIGEGRAYSVCNSLSCRDCGLVFLDMRFDDEEMEALYSGYRNQAYTAARDQFEPGYAARNAVIEAGSSYLPIIESFLAPYLRPQPRVLDWGGDTGVNTPFRGRTGLHHVYDISSRPMVAKAVRVDREWMLNESYDLIVLSHVLEHIPDPKAMLAEVVTVMKSGTYLYLEIPHEEFIRLRETNPKLLKRHWHEHINFFTQESLDQLLEVEGLEIVARAENEVNVAARDAIIISILSRLKGAG